MSRDSSLTGLSPVPPLFSQLSGAGQLTEAGVVHNPWDSDRGQSRGLAISALGGDPSEGLGESRLGREKPEQGRGRQGSSGKGGWWVPTHLTADPRTGPGTPGLCELAAEMHSTL